MSVYLWGFIALASIVPALCGGGHAGSGGSAPSCSLFTADATESLALVPIGIRFIEGMTMGAMSSTTPLPGRRIAHLQMLGRRQNLEVIGPHTPTMAALVVNVLASGDRPNEEHIARSMRFDGAAEHAETPILELPMGLPKPAPTAARFNGNGQHELRPVLLNC